MFLLQGHLWFCCERLHQFSVYYLVWLIRHWRVQKGGSQTPCRLRAYLSKDWLRTPLRLCGVCQSIWDTPRQSPLPPFKIAYFNHWSLQRTSLLDSEDRTLPITDLGLWRITKSLSRRDGNPWFNACDFNAKAPLFVELFLASYLCRRLFFPSYTKSHCSVFPIH